MKKTRLISLIGVLSALSVILYFFEFPLFVYFPSYLKVDFSDVPAILGSIAAGPAAGVLIEFIKNVIHFFIKNNTPFASGEIANFFAGIGFLIPCALLFRKSVKGKVLVYLLSAFTMTVVANIMNYFVNLPLYGVPKEAIWPTIINFLVPFNLVKAAILSIVTAVLYSSLKGLIQKYRT